MYNPTHRFDDDSLVGPATDEPTVVWSQTFQHHVIEVVVWDDTIYATTAGRGAEGEAIVALGIDGTELWRFETG